MGTAFVDENFDFNDSNKKTKKGILSKKTLMNFITVGLIGVSMLGALTQANTLIDGYKKYSLEQTQKDEIFKLADNLKEIGFNNFSLKVKSSDSKDIMNSFASKSNVDNSCTVTLFVNSKAMKDNEKFEDVPLDRLSDLVLLSAQSSVNEKSIQRFALYHELGHCDELKNPGLYDFGGNLGALLEKAESSSFQASNFLKEYLGGERKTDTISSLVSESYAESIAQILSEKDKLGGNMDSTKLKRELSSYYNRAFVGENQTYSHDFYYLSNYAKTDNFKERVASLNSIEDVRSYATELAHENLKQVFATKDISTLYDAQYLKREAIMNYRGEVLNKLSSNIKMKDGIWRDMVSELKSHLTEDQIQRFEAAVKLELHNPNIDVLSLEDHTSIASIYHEIYKAAPDFQNIQLFKDVKSGIKEWTADVKPIYEMTTHLTKDNFKENSVISQLLERKEGLSINRDVMRNGRDISVEKVSFVKNKNSPT